MTTRARKVVVQVELTTDSPISEIKGYFHRLNGPYDCLAFVIEQVQVNVIQDKKKKKKV